MTIENQKGKAYEFAADLIKQLITLSTGILTLTLAFYDKFLSTSGSPTTLMVASWFVFLLSILCGVGGLMGLTGGLSGDTEPDIQGFQQQVVPAIQVITFVIALGLMIFAVVTSTNGVPTPR